MSDFKAQYACGKLMGLKIDEKFYPLSEVEFRKIKFVTSNYPDVDAGGTEFFILGSGQYHHACALENKPGIDLVPVIYYLSKARVDTAVICTDAEGYEIVCLTDGVTWRDLCLG